MGAYFNPSRTLEDKIGFAGANYEFVQAIPQIVSYLGGDNPDAIFAGIAAHEQKLQDILLTYLTSRADVVVYGDATSDAAVRVPTIAFAVAGCSPRQIVQDVERVSNVGIKNGHFYSKRLCDEILQLGPEGVVRASMVHYNTQEEVHAFVETLKKVLPKDARPSTKSLL